VQQIRTTGVKKAMSCAGQSAARPVTAYPMTEVEIDNFRIYNPNRATHNGSVN